MRFLDTTWELVSRFLCFLDTTFELVSKFLCFLDTTYELVSRFLCFLDTTWELVSRFMRFLPRLPPRPHSAHTPIDTTSKKIGNPPRHIGESLISQFLSEIYNKVKSKRQS